MSELSDQIAAFRAASGTVTTLPTHNPPERVDYLLTLPLGREVSEIFGTYGTLDVGPARLAAQPTVKANRTMRLTGPSGSCALLLAAVVGHLTA